MCVALAERARVRFTPLNTSMVRIMIQFVDSDLVAAGVQLERSSVLCRDRAAVVVGWQVS